MKALLSALTAALILAGCAHAGPPVDLSPTPAPPPRVYHAPHQVAPPHPVARPVVPHPKKVAHVVPLPPTPPTVAPLGPQAPFDDRWMPQGPKVVQQAVEVVELRSVWQRRLNVALSFLAGILLLTGVSMWWRGRRSA
jgi:hypothetical protein